MYEKHEENVRNCILSTLSALELAEINYDFHEKIQYTSQDFLNATNIFWHILTNKMVQKTPEDVKELSNTFSDFIKKITSKS